MPTLPTPLLRALEGVAEQSGRTVVIAGPPLSGKSKLLAELREGLVARDARIVALQGSYRGRNVPYGALDGLRSPPGSAPRAGADPTGEPATDAPIDGPIAPVAFDPERLPSRRRGRGERARGAFLGAPVRERSANEGDPDGYWRELLPEFRGAEAHPVGLLIEDAALFDAESRDFIVALSQRARFRPLVIALTLDSSVAGGSLWEERFFGRGDVDWVHTTVSAPDPREVRRLRELFETLPPATRRVAGFIALLGGSVGDIVLARVCRMNYTQLADALLPASGVGLVRAQEGRVTIPHPPWIPLTAELLPEADRAEMHQEIAEALSALSPEPNLARRIEVARHYLAAGPGPQAMASLLEAAEISVQLLSFDAAADLLTDAVDCLTSIAPVDRKPVEPEMRLLYARALFYAGRPSEAEAQVREGVDGAIAAEIPATELGELVEPLLLAMRVVGPRHSLTTTLVELADRCHDARLTEVEVLLQVLIAEFHRERLQLERSRAEAHRAAVLARKLPERHLQALGLLTMGFSRMEGDATDQELADRFLRAARVLLGRARRWELDYLAGEFEADLVERRGEPGRSRALRERVTATLQRERLLSVEMYHVVGIARTLLDQGLAKGLDAQLARGRKIAETLHLLPPSPALLALWMLVGRRLAMNGETVGARDRWSALADLPASHAIPRLRAEALVRLALLECSSGGTEEGAALVRRLDEPDLAHALPAGWAEWLPHLAELAPRAARGGGPHPPPEDHGAASATAAPNSPGYSP